MTHEQFIELSTAKLAKQAGFDWRTYPHYQDVYKDELLQAGLSGNWNQYKDCYSAPTQSVLQRWLREVQGCSVIAYPQGEAFMLTRSDLFEYVTYKINGEYLETIDGGENYHTYEAALEKGLQECLTILIEKQ